MWGAVDAFLLASLRWYMSDPYLAVSCDEHTIGPLCVCEKDYSSIDVKAFTKSGCVVQLAHVLCRNDCRVPPITHDADHLASDAVAGRVGATEATSPLSRVQEADRVRDRSGTGSGQIRLMRRALSRRLVAAVRGVDASFGIGATNKGDGVVALQRCTPFVECSASKWIGTSRPAFTVIVRCRPVFSYLFLVAPFRGLWVGLRSWPMSLVPFGPSL